MVRALRIFLLGASVFGIALSQIFDAASFDLRNINYWRELAPNLHVNDPEFLQQQGAFSDSGVDQSAVHEQILHEGYTQLDSLDWQLPLEDMVALIDKLHALQIPITFCFMYDEFWFIFMRLHFTLRNILGADYKRLPDFWAWRVDPKQSERGWHMHRDKGHETLYSNGMPKSLSVWIPLTDATTANGCIYALPADRDPTYRTQELLFPHFGRVAADIRALPVQAGGALIWNQLLWHWGSHSNHRGTHPRVSLAVEFQAAPTPPAASSADSVGVLDDAQVERARAWGDLANAADTDLYGDTVRAYNTPITDPLLLFGFNDRLAMVAKQIMQYREMYPLTAEVAQLAQRITDELGDVVV